MILMIDNFDSFTYNLVQYFKILGREIVVKKNNEVSIADIEKMNPDIIVISPGPKNPKEAGITLDVIKKYKGKKPILGICLGHQAIAESFGGEVVRALTPMHGRVSKISHNGKGVFKGLKDEIMVTRYHSLVAKRESLPKELEITAWTSEGEIMGIRHREHLIEGVQFHPEAILTEFGLKMLENFLLEVENANKGV